MRIEETDKDKQAEPERRFTCHELNILPELPGIYKMINAQGTIIYIGKSKCLKSRVKSYFAASPTWEKVKKMVSQIDTIEYTVTDTHLEARLLECQLIKYYQPMFNAQLKNDKRYVYLKIETDPCDRLLTLSAHRQDDTYGPFRRKHVLETLLEQLKKIYPLHDRNDTYEFAYHFFPVKMEEAEFLENRNIFIDLLSDSAKMDLFLQTLHHKMTEASDRYKFEIASLYRDILLGFQSLRNGLNGYHDLASKNILLKLPLDGGFKLFFVAKGCIVLKEVFPFLTRKEENSFIRRGKQLLAQTACNPNEKAQIDYRDILYSEIMSLSKDKVRYLNETYARRAH